MEWLDWKSMLPTTTPKHFLPGKQQKHDPTPDHNPYYSTEDIPMLPRTDEEHHIIGLIQQHQITTEMKPENNSTNAQTYKLITSWD